MTGITQTEKIMKFKKALFFALPGFLAAAMVGIAALLHEKEIIFPEAAAIATGLFAAPKKSWQVSNGKILLLISICAVAGWAISAFLPVSLWIKMSAALIAAQFVLLFSRTNFAPLISAAVLPVMLGTQSLIYPAAAIVLTATVVLIRILLEKSHIKDAETYTPLPKPAKSSSIGTLLCCALCVVCIWLACTTKWTYAVAPPLLVAFTEWCSANSRARQKPIQAVLLICLCAICGALFRYLFSVLPDWNPALAAAMAVWTSIAIMTGFKMYLPPAAAMSVLAMLVEPAKLAIYPVQVLFGSCILMGIALLLYQIKKRRKKMLCVKRS